MGDSKKKHRIIIASDDGSVYSITDKDLKKFKVDKPDRDVRRAIKLSKKGASHAAWKSAEPICIYMVSMLSLKHSHRPDDDDD